MQMHGPKLFTIAEVAKRELEAADGKVEIATKAMVRHVRADDRLYRQLMDFLVQQACYSTICAVQRKNRRPIWDQPQPSPKDVRRRIRVFAKGLMAFPLRSGLRLGDAFREEIEADSKFYLAQANDMHVKGRWLALVAKKLPPNKPVGRVLTETKLKQLKAAAEKGVS